MIQVRTIGYPKAHMNDDAYRVDIKFWVNTWDEISEMFTKLTKGAELWFVVTSYHNKYGEAIRHPRDEEV